MMCDFEVYTVLSIRHIECGPQKRTLKCSTEIVKKLQDLQNVIMMGTLLYS